MLTPSEAAEIVGCDPAHIRLLLRRGILKGKRKILPGGTFVYQLSPKAVFAYRDKPVNGRGWRRGQKRSKR